MRCSKASPSPCRQRYSSDRGRIARSGAACCQDVHRSCPRSCYANLSPLLDLMRSIRVRVRARVRIIYSAIPLQRLVCHHEVAFPSHSASTHSVKTEPQIDRRSLSAERRLRV